MSRLCGKCWQTGGTDYGGRCINCHEYHGTWYDGFRSREHLEQWRAEQRAALTEDERKKSDEMRVLGAQIRAERDAEIRRSDLALAAKLGAPDPEMFADAAGWLRRSRKKLDG